MSHRPSLDDLVGSEPTAAVLSPTERDILRTAIDLFGRQGYVATSTRAIAAAANVTAPLIGYHFGNKEGLFHRCTEIVFGGLSEGVLAATVSDAGLKEAVRSFARAHLEVAERHPDALRFALTVVYGPGAGLPNLPLFQGHHAVAMWAEGLLKEAIEKGEFVPRRGARPASLVRHLFHMVHLEVFATFERERFAHELEAWDHECVAGIDRIDDIVDQFFLGAGDVREAKGSEGKS